MVSNIIKFAIPVLALIVWASVFTVDERQRAILFKFGEILASDFEPGLHLKVPVINNVRKFDKRILTIDNQAERFLTAEKKDLIVDSFVSTTLSSITRRRRVTRRLREDSCTRILTMACATSSVNARCRK